jgi:hypothetical protein
MNLRIWALDHQVAKLCSPVRPKGRLPARGLARDQAFHAQSV